MPAHLASRNHVQQDISGNTQIGSKYKMTTTENYIKKVKAQLRATYGNIPEDWDLLIEMLEDELNLYNRMKNELDVTGILNEKGFKNPLISSLKDSKALILKMVQQLGSSPWAKSKIKLAEEDDSENFIENLIK